MITVDQLFAEQFVPAWLARKKLAERQGLNEAVTTELNYMWSKAAHASYKRILKRVDAKNNYCNPI